MLEVVTGPFHPALERGFVERLKAAKQDPLAPLVVVAPSRRLAARLKELALEAIPRGVANVHFHNLYSFAKELYEGRKGWRLVEDDLFHEKLVAQLIEKHLAGGTLRRALESRGGARAVLGALKDLRDGAVDGTAAIDLFVEGGLDEEKSGTLGDLLKLHVLYAAALQDRKVHSRSDVVRLAAESAGQLAGSRIFYYGFYELVQAQIDLFRALSQWCEVTCFYPLVEGDGDFAFAQAFFDEIVRGAATKRTAIACDRSAVEPVVVATSGSRDEVWACAKWVLEQRDRGVPFREIGVVARTLDPYVEHLESVFGEHAIPFTSSASVPVEREPLHVAAKRLLELAEGDFRRDDVIDLLSSRTFRKEEADDVARWDLATRHLGIGHGAAEWRRRVVEQAGKEYVFSEGPRGRERKFVLSLDQVDRLVARVKPLLERSPAPTEGTWTQRAAWARGLVAEFLETDGALDDAFDALASLDEVLPPPTAREFQATFRQRLSRAVRPAGRENIAGVQVLDAMAARGIAFRATWVLGMNEKVFPRTILEDAFVPDAARAKIGARLGARLPVKVRGYEEERLLFRLLRDGAREVLVLSTQRSDDRGRLQVPSVLLAGRTAVSLPRRPKEKLRTAALERLTPTEAVVRAELLSGRGVETARALGRRVEAFEESLAFLHAIDTEREPGIRDGRTGPLPEWWERARTRGLSPTAMETYATCGFLFFAQKVLGLEELEEPESEAQTSAMETGNLYHEILEQCYQTTDFEDAAEAAFRRLEEKRSIRHPVLWEAEQARIRKVLERFIQHDRATSGSFVPFRFEERVEGTLAGAAFVGFVDRIDIAKDALRVIDYKKSKSKFQQTMETAVFNRELLFQPPLYLLLAAKKLREAGRTIDLGASKSGYFFLEEEEQPAMWLENFDEREKEWMGILERKLTGLATGEFVLKEGGHCRYCEFATVCRKSHIPTRLRARR